MPDVLKPVAIIQHPDNHVLGYVSAQLTAPTFKSRKPDLHVKKYKIQSCPEPGPQITRKSGRPNGPNQIGRRRTRSLGPRVKK